MVYGVVRHEKASRHQVRYHRLIAAIIDVFLCVEKTEPDTLTLREVVKCVTADQLNDVKDAADFEGRPCKFSLLIQNLKSGDFPRRGTTSKGEP